MDKKLISILGDSVSTLEGWNPEGYNLFYKGEKCEISGVREYQDTWWGQLIGYLGGELLVNNSWSGSRVTKLPDREQLFPSGISDERINSLGDGGRNPDIIIVFLGYNDWGHGVCLSDQKNCGNQRSAYVFCDAYDYLLEKLKSRYPDAEIYCCALFTTYMPLNPWFVFPSYLYGNSIEAFNEVIRTTARRRNCRLLDLYFPQAPVSTLEGSHPDKAGMTQIAKSMYRWMSPSPDLVDCENDDHYYTRIESDPYGTNVLDLPTCLCRKCYKIVELYPDWRIGDFFTLVQANSGYRYSIYPGSNTGVYTADQYFGGRLPDEYEIIAHAEQLLDFLCFCHDPKSEARLNSDRFHFFFSPGRALIDENGYWILSSLVGEPKHLFVNGFNAPEAQSGVLNEQTDIFSFGMLLYWMATQIDPSNPPYLTPKVRKANPSLSRSLSKLIEKCIEIKPEKRYRSFDEIWEKLYRIKNRKR